MFPPSLSAHWWETSPMSTRCFCMLKITTRWSMLYLCTRYGCFCLKPPTNTHTQLYTIGSPQKVVMWWTFLAFQSISGGRSLAEILFGSANTEVALLRGCSLHKVNGVDSSLLYHMCILNICHLSFWQNVGPFTSI